MKKVSNGVYTHEGIRVVKNSKGMYVASVHVEGEAFPRVINATTQKAFVAIYDSIKAEESGEEDEPTMEMFLNKAIEESANQIGNEAMRGAFIDACNEIKAQFLDDEVEDIMVCDIIMSNLTNNCIFFDDGLVFALADKWDKIQRHAEDILDEFMRNDQTHVDAMSPENVNAEYYTQELLRSINMFASLVANDYNGATHCKARLDELVNELLAEGYKSAEKLTAGDTVITNKKGQHHNVGKVYEVTFDNSYIVTFGGIYIAQCYDREELIKIGTAN